MLLHALPHIDKAAGDEELFYIEKHKMMGIGTGQVDCHLPASCKLGKATLLTKDRGLHDSAAQLNLLEDQAISSSICREGRRDVRCDGSRIGL